MPFSESDVVESLPDRLFNCVGRIECRLDLLGVILKTVGPKRINNFALRRDNTGREEPIGDE